MILKMAGKHKARDAIDSWSGMARIRLTRRFLLQCRPSS
jgi:hypothetical protein